MSLPRSGSISMSQINTELNRSATANISIDSAENGSYAAINSCSYYKPSATNPASMSEWRGYDHNIMCPTTGYCGAGGKGLIQLTAGQSATHTITVGSGPGIFRFRVAFYGVWPNQFPTWGSGTPDAWWRARITIAGSSYDVLWKGGILSGLSGYYNNIETNGTHYDEFYSWILSGSSQISIAVDAYSPDLVLNFAYWTTCITSGSVVGLHWSPDTSANACNSSYVYFDGGTEPDTNGYSGYRNFLVSGNGALSSGNTIYAFPTGSATSTFGSTNHNSSAASGFTGGLSYTFPVYNSASPLSGDTRASVPSYTSVVAADGYYSDGTNWAYVSGGAGVISSSGSCCPAYGTLLSTYCSGYTEIGVYADGSCGTYDQVISSNSSNCNFNGCTIYSFTTFGFDSYTDCTGTSQYEYLLSGDTRCIDNNYPPSSNWTTSFQSCI